MNIYELIINVDFQNPTGGAADSKHLFPSLKGALEYQGAMVKAAMMWVDACTHGQDFHYCRLVLS